MQGLGLGQSLTEVRLSLKITESGTICTCIVSVKEGEKESGERS